MQKTADYAEVRGLFLLIRSGAFLILFNFDRFHSRPDAVVLLSIDHLVWTNAHVVRLTRLQARERAGDFARSLGIECLRIRQF